MSVWRDLMEEYAKDNKKKEEDSYAKMIAENEQRRKEEMEKFWEKYSRN